MPVARATLEMLVEPRAMDARPVTRFADVSIRRHSVNITHRTHGGREAHVVVLDLRVVRAVATDGRHAIEQIDTRNSHVIKPEAAVVDAVEAHLVPAVLDPDARERRAVGVAQRHEQCVDAVLLVVDRELRKDRRHLRVLRPAADPVLLRRVARRVDDPLVTCTIKDRRRLDAADVRTVPQLFVVVGGAWAKQQKRGAQKWRPYRS